MTVGAQIRTWFSFSRANLGARMLHIYGASRKRTSNPARGAIQRFSKDFRGHHESVSADAV